jgi:hypothetical protein
MRGSSAWFVRRVDGAEVDLGAVVKHMRRPELGGPDDDLALDIGQVRTHVLRVDGLAQKLSPEVGVGNRDQRDRALLYALAVQVGHAMLGDDVVYVAPRGHHPGAGTETCHDPGDASVPGRGGQGDDRPAAR